MITLTNRLGATPVAVAFGFFSLRIFCGYSIFDTNGS